MTQSSRSRTIAAALAAALCVGALSAQFAVAQATLGPAVQRAEPTAVTDRAGKQAPRGFVLRTEDQRVGQRAIAALRSEDPANYRIETTDPNGRRTVLGSLSPDVLERSAPQVASAQHRAVGRRFILIIIIITVRSAANAAAYSRLNTALRSADAASYSLTEVH